MGFLTALSDDQLALLGCVAAFFLFGGMMSLSYYVGGAGRTTSERNPRAGRIVHGQIASAHHDERKAA